MAEAQTVAPPAEIDAFAEQQFAQLIEAGELVGGAMVVVHQGQLIYSRGFGYESLEHKHPVDPARTVFRLGSVSKLFTSVAVLQLVEQKKLALDAPLASYMPEVPIPNNFDEPVRLWHCLTHTHGFDPGWIIAGAALDPSEQLPLGTFLAERLPPRIAPPGETYVYSDVGFALAGYAVERAAQQPLAHYLREHVFQPLAMQQSTFEQQLPAELARNLAPGYRYAGKTLKRQPYCYVLPTPAAGMSSRPLDMAPFMIALLEGGTLGQYRLLRSESVSQLFQKHFTHHPEMLGTALGLYEERHAGYTYLQQTGAMPGYCSVIVLVPEQRLGLFLTCNQFGSDKFNGLIEEFFAQMLPSRPMPQSQQPTPVEGKAHYVGRFRYLSHSHATLARLAAFGGAVRSLNIYRTDDGALCFRARGENRWEEVQPGLFRHFDDFITLHQNHRGRLQLEMGLWAFERVSWYEDERLHWLGLPALLLVLGTVVLRGALGRRFLWGRSDAERQLRQLLWATAVVQVFFALSLAFALWYDDPYEWYYGVPLPVIVLLCLPILAAGLTCLAGAKWGRLLWRERKYWRRLEELLVLGCLTLFALATWYWNLMGYHL